MKILTLNTHSIIEPDYEKKLNIFAEMIKQEKPDVFALQEVNQSMDEDEVQSFLGFGYVPCKEVNPTVRRDNHALKLDLVLRSMGVQYNWTWIPLKIGYDIYEEGLAIFSLTPIAEIKQFYISKSQDMNNWKTRKMLGIKTGGNWFYSVHMGWWDDLEEPFIHQWDRVNAKLASEKAGTEHHFIMGDFNCPSNTSGEGYEYVSDSGWLDTWMIAKDKDNGITVGTVIDGWKDRVADISEEAESIPSGYSASDVPCTVSQGMRIDYVWCNHVVPVKSSKVICNGYHYPVVSDHYGVMVEVNMEELRR